MNETRGNARTKPMKNQKCSKKTGNFEREPLKEREINSLKDTEKTNDKHKGCKRLLCNAKYKCEDCFYWLICNPDQAPDRDYHNPYTAYDDLP